MGKDSKHQRTKGGIQPSSASRTAELLEKTGGTGQPLTFLAAVAEANQEFSALNNVLPTGVASGSPVHGILANVLIDDDLPPELRLIFRKLQKKDATTKIKALGELSQLCENIKSGAENPPCGTTDDNADATEDTKTNATIDLHELSKSVLPQWCKCFPKLTVDDSRKVRELTQSTHAVICKSVGRSLAPFLKQLVPHWYLAQFDIYGPVAYAATESYQTVFPNEKKREEVLKFCISEIAAHLSSNLETVFKTKAKGDQQKDKKKQNTKKNKETPNEDVEQESKQPEIEGKNLMKATDSESYETRTCYATLLCIGSLIHLQLLSQEFLDFVFGNQGVFWDGAEHHKDLLIKRSCFDLLSTFLSTTGSPDTATEVSIPSGRCTKLMTVALTTTQKEILPNVWNAFMTLTLKGILKDGHLAQKQLIACCKNGFYGNASQIGPSVLPLLARMWDGYIEENKKVDFANELVESFIKGYKTERSNFEKAVILRTFAEAIAFLIRNEACDVQRVHQFIFDYLKSINNEFPKLIGALVKDPLFYSTLTKKAIDSNVLNTKEYGEFIVGLATQPVSLYSDAKPVARKTVKFRDPTDINDATAGAPTFESLPDHKRTFIQDFVQTCMVAGAYKPLSIVSRHFQDVELWSLVNMADFDLSKEEDKTTRLRLSLDLIQLYPENPQILGIFSDQFEFFRDPADLQVFLKELCNFTHLQPIKKWIRMSIFTDVIEGCLNASDVTENELLTILKFILHDIFSESFLTNICYILVSRMERDDKFFEDLARIMTYSNFKADLAVVYGKFWESLLQKTMDNAVEVEDTSLELSESVCVRNRGKLSTHCMMETLGKQLETCKTVKQVNSLVEVCKKLEFVEIDIELAVRVTPLNIKPEMLSFIGCSYTEILHDSLDLVPKFSDNHQSIILKSIFNGKFIQDKVEDLRELIQPAINVLYAQSVARIWTEVEKSEYFHHLSDELVLELDVISSRLIESICTDSNARKEFKNEIEKIMDSQDVIWMSKLPIRILLEYCHKSEIKFDWQPPSTSVEQDITDLKSQADKLLKEFSVGIIPMKKSIEWITEKRANNAGDFEFDKIFRHTNDKTLMTKLLFITLELLERVDQDHEEFLSSAACWIEAWLKHTKNLEASSKAHLLWISSLARGVTIIGQRARALDNTCPKFLQEYVEFHCAQIYPIIYALYHQLNTEVKSHSFWTMQALYYVSGALATMPGTTLCFIEPDSIKVCDIFSLILGNGVSLPTRIAAYKVLRKVKYDTGEAKDLPIIPPGIDEVIRGLMIQLKKSEIEEQGHIKQATNEELKPLLSYLLIWDALLKIQQKSNEFASYVRDQEHLLTPFLNTLFFSETITLENSTSKYFDTDPIIVPGTKINLLHFSCSVLQRALRNLPYTVRWWWNNNVTKQRDRVFVEKFVVKHLSSKLATEELGGVKLREGIDDNVTVHCHSGCNELVAHYRIEETNVTLTISLPLNHPLGPVTVRISDKKLHAKISHLLNTRSHSLSAGLKLWKENLDGLYKDVDECAICFFILHHVTKQTPKLACKTCRKKFHAACLYKWFSTSNKSECPLCRNLF